MLRLRSTTLGGVTIGTVLWIRSRYARGMTGPHPDTGANGVQALDPQQLGAYFALMEAVSLLQHQVEQQLRTEGDLSYVQFQLLARLAEVHGQLTMTQLADGVVYSRSGLTYQASLLEKAGLITRGPQPRRRTRHPGHHHRKRPGPRRPRPARPHPGRAPPAVRPPDRRRPAPPRRHHDPRTRPHARPATPLRRPPQTPPQPHPSAPGRDAGLNRNSSLGPAPRLVGGGRHGPGDGRGPDATMSGRTGTGPAPPAAGTQQRAVDRVVGADPCRGRRPDS